MTEFRVSYWTDDDPRNKNGQFDPSQSAALSIYLDSQTLLFDREAAMSSTFHLEITKALIAKLASVGFNKKIHIHKIWIP